MKSIHTQIPERQGLPKGKLLRVCCVLACALVNPYALAASALTPEETQTEVQQDTKHTQRRISGRIVDDTGEGGSQAWLLPLKKARLWVLPTAMAILTSP